MLYSLSTLRAAAAAALFVLAPCVLPAAPAQEPGRRPVRADRFAGDRFQQHPDGSSPFDAPEATDTTFVVDTGPGLDTGCTFRSGGPLVIELDVTRYIGDLASLKQNGGIKPTALLRMPAYDVDFDAVVSGGFPERDEVRFNGHLVDEKYLTGADGVWKLNAFQIPVEWINWPAAPGSGGPPEPATNTIEIRIDVANAASGQELWCTAIDWVALDIEVVRPVVFAHGILSSSAVWDTIWVPQMNRLGIPNNNQMGLRLDMGNLDSIASNATKIGNVVQQMLTRLGVEKVVLVAHSKGGLDSRQFAEKTKAVSQVVQIGTPNAGSPLADAIQSASVALLGLGKSLLVNAIAGPAGIQLTTWYMSAYNASHSLNPKVRYTVMAGDYSTGCGLNPFCHPLDRALLAITGAGDTIVPVTSAHALAAMDRRTHASTGSNRSATHTELEHSQTVYSKLEDRVLDRSSKGGSGPVAGAGAFTPGVHHVGVLAQGGEEVFELVVDGVTPTVFTLLYPSGEMDLVLTDPTGKVWDGATAAASPNAGWEEGDILGGRVEVFQFETPAAGTWTARVTATSVVEPGGEAAFQAGVWMEDPAIAFSTAFRDPDVLVGEDLVVEATLDDGGVPVTGASVSALVALPDDTTVTVALADDGVPPDTAAGDGIYTGAFLAGQAGMYRTLVQASDGGTMAQPFSRQGFLLGTAAEGDVRLLGPHADAGEDTNGNGFFDWLVLTVNLANNLAGPPARYRIVGELEDSAGNVHVATEEVDLAAGTGSVELRFDGSEIFAQGVDGPYTVTSLRLYRIDDPAIMEVEESLNAHTTQAYTYDQFEHTPIALTGAGSDVGVDDDGNGKFDRLEISVEVLITRSDFYDWSARLVDQAGVEIAFVSGSGSFGPGVNDLTFSVPGTAIGAHGVDGPYILRDLLIFGGTDSLVAGEVWETAPYAASEFEGFVPPPPPPGGGGGATYGTPEGCQVRPDARPDGWMALALLGALAGLGWLARRRC